MKKKIVLLLVCAIVIVSFVGTIAHAAALRYSNGIVMTYDLYAAHIGSSAGAAAYTTSSDSTSDCFLSMFSYKNGTCKNSGSTHQLAYVYMGLTANGGNLIVSHHSLRDGYLVPYGGSRSLEVNP